MRPIDPSQQEVALLRAYTLASRTAIAMLGPGDAADEVAQQVVIRALERRSQLRDPARFDAWVHRIAIRETWRTQRGMSARAAREEGLDHDSPDVARESALQDQIALAEGIRIALRRLPERERAALTLRYVHDLTDSQIAAALGCRRGTVHSLMSRARARLRAMPDIQALSPITTKELR